MASIKKKYQIYLSVPELISFLLLLLRT